MSVHKTIYEVVSEIESFGGTITRVRIKKSIVVYWNYHGCMNIVTASLTPSDRNVQKKRIALIRRICAANDNRHR